MGTSQWPVGSADSIAEYGSVSYKRDTSPAPPPPPPTPTTIGNITIGGSGTVTENDTVTYSASNDGDAGGLTYKWTVTGGNPTGLDTQSSCEVTWGAAGNGKVSCKVTSSDENASDSPKTKEKSVSIAALFKVTAIGTVSIVGDQNPTEGDTATYEAMNTGDATGLQYDWNVSNGSVNGAKNKKTINVTVGSSGNMTLQCRVSSDDASVTDSPVMKEANIPVAFPPASFGNVSLEGLQQMSIGEQQTVTAKYDGDVKSPIYRWKLLGPSGEIVSGGGLDDDSVVVKATSAGSFDVSCTFDASDFYVADRNKEAKLGISIMPNDQPPSEEE